MATERDLKPVKEACGEHAQAAAFFAQKELDDKLPDDRPFSRGGYAYEDLSELEIQTVEYRLGRVAKWNREAGADKCGKAAYDYALASERRDVAYARKKLIESKTVEVTLKRVPELPSI
ncbi:MAG: hypothetical protein V4681_03475 [Patescibacteria group bacterium]